MLREEEMLPVYDMDINESRPAPTKLLRDNSLLGVYDPPRHPYGIASGLSPHPEVTPARRLTYGNDNSSLVRQCRSQSKRPDPVPGVQYAGATSQTIGHARLVKLQHIKDSVHSTKEQKKLSNEHLDIQLASVTPSAFQRPHARFATGLAQVQSLHNDAFIPPMPRPPLFSAW